MGKSKIEWTDETWNPVTGCSKVSAGCKYCYAERQWPRLSAPGQPYEGRKFTGVQCHPERLEQPLHWRKPRMVFNTSMSDLFHRDVPTDFIDKVFAVMALCPQHTFQNLTKRVERQREYIGDPETPFRVQKAMDCIAVDLEMSHVREEWLSIPRFPSYHVSNFGQIRSIANGILKPRNHNGGYRSIALRFCGKTYENLIHRLVLEVFYRPPRDNEEARHRNGDRTDNRIANLSWGTKTDNMQDAARHGTAGAWMKDQARLDAATVEEIRNRRQSGELLADIAKHFGIDKRQVSAIARGNIYKAAQLSWPLLNVWLGVSAEDQGAWDERSAYLFKTPAAVRFASFEPLLAPINIDFGAIDIALEKDGYGNTAILGGLDWVIVGGESGPKSRPMDPGWVRSIRDECQTADVPFFFKQGSQANWRNFKDFYSFPADLRIREYPRPATI